jgi:predicted nucleic acid-binding protein
LMRPFFDTNVLVYAFDEGEPEKRQVSRRLIEEHLVGGTGYSRCRFSASSTPWY